MSLLHTKIEKFEKFVKWLRKGLNLNVDPSDDFYSFACGGFSESNYNENDGDYPPWLSGNPFENIIKNEIIKGAAIVKTREFYNSYDLNTKNLLQNERFVEYCGGFPVLNNNFSADNFDWVRAAAILDAIGFETLLINSVEYFNDKRVISVNVADMESHNVDIEELLNEKGFDVLQICELVNDINVIRGELRNLVGQDGQDSETIQITFAELRHHVFDYQSYFHTYFGQFLKDEDIFLLNQQALLHLDAIHDIFGRTNSRSVANYIGVKALIPNRTELWMKHFTLTINHFAPVVLAAGYATYWDHEEKAKWEDVFQNFCSSFIKLNQTLNLEPEIYERKISNDFSAMHQYIEENFSLDEVEAEYVNLEIGECYFQNILNMIRLGSNKFIKKCFSYRSNDKFVYGRAQQFLAELIQYQCHSELRLFSGFSVMKWRNIFSDLKCSNKSIKDYQSVIHNIANDDYDYGTGWVSSIFISLLESLRLSYEGFELWMRQNENIVKEQEKILSKINLNSKKAFFISFVQNFYYQEQSNSDKLAVLIALLNCEEFDKEFNFKVKFPMEKIHILWKTE